MTSTVTGWRPLQAGPRDQGKGSPGSTEALPLPGVFHPSRLLWRRTLESNQSDLVGTEKCRVAATSVGAREVEAHASVLQNDRGERRESNPALQEPQSCVRPLHYAHHELVGPSGIEPPSLAYQASALPLSYGPRKVDLLGVEPEIRRL